MRFKVKQKVVHALYGVGTVEKIEEKNILGQTNLYAIITFKSDRLKIMVNLDEKNEMIRELIDKEEVPRILDFLKKCRSKLPTKSSDRFNINLNKIKSADIYKLVEVIKDLSHLSQEKKLTPKELNMLKQTRKMLCSEMSFVSDMPVEEIESLVEKYSKA